MQENKITYSINSIVNSIRGLCSRLFVVCVFPLFLFSQDCKVEVEAMSTPIFPGQSLDLNMKITGLSKSVCYPYRPFNERFFNCESKFKHISTKTNVYATDFSSFKRCVEGDPNSICVRPDSTTSIRLYSEINPTNIDDFNGKPLVISVTFVLRECFTNRIDTVIKELSFQTVKLNNVEKAFWKKAITFEPRKFLRDTVKFITVHYDAQRFEPFLNKCRNCGTYPLALFQKLQYLAYGPIRTVISVESEDTDVVLDGKEIAKRKELIKQIRDRLGIDKGEYFYSNLVGMYSDLVSKGWNRKKSRYVTFEEFQYAQKLSATQ